MPCGGTVDVHTCTREVPCMGRRSTPSVGRLTVLHVVGVVRLQDAWSDRSRLSVEVVCVRLVGVVRLQDHRFDTTVYT